MNLEIEHDAEARLAFKPLVSAFLPMITREISEDLRGTSLIQCDTDGKWSWTQEAVDLVCVLNNAQAFFAR